ncbi:PAS domain-containing sensor histidine kinase [Lusitaniella coriacea LEGE 07157]|uniref:histidine kinase n=1 Tax=Lusitaniella coriacea LEGE 07157 TaxID=945747 RepID=A0A8J7DU40_9CYAN|nr:PAS domain-containing sensor histidine kinase [Lusitaniella coriacea]MBE9114966.1 PAS domain-containing sensor histidine kinase [Lusitaniella coriacea LEGE 07157]
MLFFTFVLGLSVGLGFYALKRYQFNRMVRKMLQLSSEGMLEKSDLSLMSRLRSEISRGGIIRRHLETELQNWQQVMEAAPIGYLQVDEDNQLLWCNSYARQLLKLNRWNPDELRLLLEWVRSYELDRAIEQTRREQKSQVQEWIFQMTDLPPDVVPESRDARNSLGYSLALRAVSLPLAGGQVGVLLENQQPLLELSLSRDRAFSDLAHELKTPLTSIRLVAEALQNRLEGTERTWVDKMLQEINRLIDFVRDCLELNQLEKQRNGNLNYQPIELKNLVFELWQALEPLVQAKSIALDYSEPDSLSLSGDRSQLRRVFRNLFENSIRYSPPQGTIRVEVKVKQGETVTQTTFVDPNSWIIINVIDSGCGFQESDLPYVFDRLYRGDPSRARQPSNPQQSRTLPNKGGSGLGLAIVRQIVQSHGGAIAAQNHPDTGGAWLKIKLPAII